MALVLSQPLVVRAAAEDPLLPVAEEIRAEVKTQLTSPVRWTESVRAMAAMGANVFVELGPKDVLACLIRRIDPQSRAVAAGAPEEIRAVLGV